MTINPRADDYEELEAVFKAMGDLRRLRLSGCHDFEVQDFSVTRQCRKCGLGLSIDALDGNIPDEALDLLARCPSSEDRVRAANAIIADHHWSQTAMREAE